MYLLTPRQKYGIIVATRLYYVISLDRCSDPSRSVKCNRALDEEGWRRCTITLPLRHVNYCAAEEDESDMEEEEEDDIISIDDTEEEEEDETEDSELDEDWRPNEITFLFCLAYI